MATKTIKKASPKKEASTFKTRSPLFLKQMSDAVNAKVEEKAEQLGVAKWVVIETILESTLGIDTGVDLNKWLGVNANRARTGLPPKGKVKK